MTYLVDQLKSKGHIFAAGALAFSLGLDREYGCHFGMRSDRSAAIDDYQRGYDAAKRDANEQGER
jgi:hypothetical protein